MIDHQSEHMDEISELSGQLAEALKPEPIRTPMSLYKIQSELSELTELMREAQEDLESGLDPAAGAQIQVIENQIAKYLGAEIEKIDSYHGLLKFGVNLIDQIKAEEARLKRQRNAWEATVNRVKAVAVFVMQAMGKKRLEGSHGRRLRLHPSPVSVDVTDPASIPPQFIMVTVQMTLEAKNNMREMFPSEYAKLIPQGPSEVSLSRIKAFIEAGQECPECDLVSACNKPPCPRCNGTGRIPGSVPGARLVKDSVHLRVE